MSRAALSISPRTSRSSKLREQAIIRDGGYCAICRADTMVFGAALDAMRSDSTGSLTKASAYRDTLRAMGIKAGQALVEVDHIIPISEGGADELGNLRCLCTYGRRCHQAETKKLAARRARKPKSRAEKVYAESYEARGEFVDVISDGAGGKTRMAVCECFGLKPFSLARTIAHALNKVRRPVRGSQ